ncbi:hypothetical protein, partial [Streptomyces sp. SID3343]|uniref:hypothetical protein n=1 Tax=Streptomyces sp. SID3343 TaxID=2690260 RepID=UPI0013C293FF
GRAPARVGLSRPIHPGSDARDGLLGARLVPWIERGRADGRFPPDFTPADYLAVGNMYTGSPEDVARALRADPGLAYATDLLCHSQPARLSPSELLPAMELTAKKVRPLLLAG